MTAPTLPMPRCIQCQQDATHAAIGPMVEQMYREEAVWLCPRDARVIVLLAERFSQNVELMPRWEHYSRFGPTQ